MRKVSLILFLFVGVLTGSIFLSSCTRKKPQSYHPTPVPPSTAIEITYSVPEINAIIANKITYMDADNKQVVVDNPSMPWTKKVQTNAPFTATLKIENSLIPNVEIPDLITLKSGYTISCTGAVEKVQTSSFSMTIKKAQLDKWLAHPAKKYSYTFTVGDK